MPSIINAIAIQTLHSTWPKSALFGPSFPLLTCCALGTCLAIEAAMRADSCDIVVVFAANGQDAVARSNEGHWDDRTLRGDEVESSGTGRTDQTVKSNAKTRI